MSLKRVEVESLGKSFLLYFEDLFTKMRLCSFDLKCTQFEFDFISADQDELYHFHKNGQGAYALFSIPNTSEYVMKLIYPYEEYQNQ